MRTTRAAIAGLGTTGTLVAAAACIFLVASAVLAFRGWPGLGLANRIGNLFVNDAPPVKWNVPGTRAVAAGAGVAAGAVAAAPSGAPFGPGAGTPDGGPPTDGGPTRSPTGPVVTGGPTDGGGSAASTGLNPALPCASCTPPAPPNPGAAVQQASHTVSQTVRDTTSTAGNAVGGSVGSAVSGAGQSLGGTLDSAGGSAGQLLGGK
jgi:hypothetical protein